MTWAKPNSGTNRVCPGSCVTVPVGSQILTLGIGPSVLLSTEGEGGSQGPWQDFFFHKSILFGESLVLPQATARREGSTLGPEGFVRYSEALLRQTETY